MTTGPMFLYRGETEAFHERNGSCFKPKVQGPFEFAFQWDEPDRRWDSGATWDTSEENAVVRHQFKQKGDPTSGISTTPDLKRAAVYSRGKDGRSPGLVAKIDVSRLAAHGVRQFVVADVPRLTPSVPADAEVILVTKDGAPLPEDVIVERIPIAPSASTPEE